MTKFKIKITKIVTVSVLIMVLISVLAIDVRVLAYDETAGVVTNEADILPSIEEQIDAIISDEKISLKEKEETIKKLEDCKPKASLFYDPDFPATQKHKKVYCPFFKQETTYWCGPATTKQTMHAINGSSDSQSAIANALGTTTAGSSSTNMAKYINSKQKKNTYISFPKNTGYGYLVLEDKSLQTLNKGVPVFGAVAISSGQVGDKKWKYTTSGHFLNISGVSTTSRVIAGAFEVTDPYITWKVSAITSGKYWVDSYVYSKTATSFWY